MHASEARLPLSEAAAISETLLFISYSSCNLSRGCKVDIALCGVYLIDWHAPQLLTFILLKLKIAYCMGSVKCTFIYGW